MGEREYMGGDSMGGGGKSVWGMRVWEGDSVWGGKNMER